MSLTTLKGILETDLPLMSFPTVEQEKSPSPLPRYAHSSEIFGYWLVFHLQSHHIRHCLL